MPLSVAILLGLFVLQRFGSGTIGWLFGPVIVVWFCVIAILGLSQVVKDQSGHGNAIVDGTGKRSCAMITSG